MKYIFLVAIAGILLLNATGAIPLDGVGGSMVIGLALLAAAPAVGVREAWTNNRGVLGWIVNVVVAVLGAFVIAPLGGLITVMALGPFMNGGGPIAAAGGLVMSAALVCMMVVTLLGAWSALWIVNRWR